MKQLWKVLFLALSFALLRSDCTSAQRLSVQLKDQSPRRNKLLNARVPAFEMRNETILDGLWKLARGPAPFGFGFENVLKNKFSDSDVPYRYITLQLRDKTISELLDSLCEADPRFTWSMDGITINVFPKTIIHNTSYLLNRKLEKFELRNATDVQNGLVAIVKQLPPPVEQVAEAQVGGGDPFPPEPWTVTLMNVTVRQVVNRLAAHGGPCGIWIFGGSVDFRTFGFFNTYLCPSEPPPASSSSH